MKNATYRILIATAVLGISAAAASAQSMKADIQFPFRTADRVMPAGRYTITQLPTASGAKLYKIGNQATHQGIMFLPQSPRIAPQGSPAKLMFSCTAETCVLTQLWTGDYQYRVPYKANPRDGEARTVAVLLMPSAD